MSRSIMEFEYYHVLKFLSNRPKRKPKGISYGRGPCPTNAFIRGYFSVRCGLAYRLECIPEYLRPDNPESHRGY